MQDEEYSKFGGLIKKYSPRKPQHFPQAQPGVHLIQTEKLELWPLAQALHVVGAYAILMAYSLA